MRAWSEAELPLTAEQAREVAGSGLVAAVEVGSETELWKVTSDSRIGVALGDGWEVRVEPKLDVPKLMFLLAYATDPSGWRDVAAGFERERNLFEAVASGFAFQAQRALERGPLRNYVRVEERSTALRGRLRIGDQLARLPGLPIPLEIAYDDYSLDIRENRMLRAAAELLLRFPRVPDAARARLRHVRAILEEVEPIADATMPRITRINKRYEPALVLASLVLRAASVSSRAGHVESATFVFDMNQVFEDFVSAALTDEMRRRYGGEIRLQYDREFLDESPRATLRLRPDISWWSGGWCLAILDAKYKRLSTPSFPNGDAYQMLAYCIAFDVDRGVLVYAKDETERDRSHVVRNHGCTIDVRALDVEAEPEALLAQVRQLARAVADGLRSPGRRVAA